jgi:hypothetical protein
VLVVIKEVKRRSDKPRGKGTALTAESQQQGKKKENYFVWPFSGHNAFPFIIINNEARPTSFATTMNQEQALIDVFGNALATNPSALRECKQGVNCSRLVPEVHFGDHNRQTFIPHPFHAE